MHLSQLRTQKPSSYFPSISIRAAKKTSENPFQVSSYHPTITSQTLYTNNMMAYQARLGRFSFIAALFFSVLLLDNADAAAASSSSSSSSELLEVSMIIPTWNENAEERSLRELQLTQGKCWSTRDDRKPNRYCMFEDTPRSGAFLSLSCPTTREDSVAQCQCTIGIGDSQDAPNTDTCWKCGFCRDGSLAYDCRNVAEGTCIGR